MNDFLDPQSAIEAIGKQNSAIDNYLNSDINLTSRKDLLATKINSFDFNRLIKTGKGVREIHYINYDGDKIPMRLLSIAEERQLLHETYVEFKKYPEFHGGENNPIFQEIKLIKLLSLSTSSCPELSEDTIDQRYLTTGQLGQMPKVTLLFLSNHYDQLNKQYNFLYNDKFEEEITFAIAALFDGEGMDEKKWILLNGLSSVQLSRIILRLFNVVTKLEDNAQYIILLEALNKNETNAN